MKNIVWLQLGDWHHGARDKFERNLILDKLKKDILQRRDIDPSLESIDFMVFCGDLANKATSAEYSECAKTFLTEIVKAADLPKNDGKKKNLFIVPGNHDINRTYVERFSPSGLKAPLTTPSEINEWLLQDKARQFVLDPFEDFVKCVSRFTGRKYLGYADSYIIDIKGIKVGIACLNSAWMCGKFKNLDGNVDDYGCVILGEHQVETAISNLEGADIKLAVLHHPFEWLSPVDHDLAERAICKGFDFVLTGHTHQSEPKEVKSTIGHYIMVSSGSSYDGRHPYNSLYVNSYSFVVINPISKKVKIYVRKWSEKIREWTAEAEAGPNGTVEFNLPNSKCRATAPTTLGTSVEPIANIESVMRMIAEAEAINADLNISTTITKTGTYHTVRHKDPKKPIVLPMPEFPPTELGRIGFEKFKKGMEEGREVEFLEGEAIWKSPVQLPNLITPDPATTRVVMKPVLEPTRAPVRLQLVDAKGNISHQIGFAYLSVLRIGTQEMECSISGERLGAELSFIFSGKSNTSVTFKHSLQLSKVRASDAVETIEFLVGLSNGLNLEIISLEHDKILMRLGGCSFDQAIRPYENSRVLLEFLSTINKSLGLDIRYPDGVPSEKDCMTAELLASLLEGRSISIPQDKHGSLVLGHQVGDCKDLVEMWKTHPKLVLNAELAAPFEIFGHSIAVKNIKLHYLDTAPADGLDELTGRMDGLGDEEYINIPITYSKVVFEAKVEPAERTGRKTRLNNQLKGTKPKRGARPNS